ncbi:prepilin-type N-terminal cleavage/methylation domain-containing protein [Deinococcus multiflagellatus]|uniref:Prepilin-type N-terminal cleavage/methylation domain-containing protein n=1 Tax=Deinococcus multiflagellatus TaxID=1656887 RepID=A0ABW1ZRS1_9DEIO|nr:prepilin-type N-terminal cleavage/methylation domain-containing protein [Deinococcus multiflagellatus]MBZ9714410.1 prepilin-type N-terminal cleavage/methylation domain-containing protein [Deinococcus multiflagellatus]
MERGFTLVELLVVVVILALLGSIMLMTYAGSLERGRTQAARAHAQLAAQTTNSVLAVRPDLNAAMFDGLDCMKAHTFAPAGVTLGSNATYPTYPDAPDAVTGCVLSPTSARSVVATVTVGGQTFREGQ